jgi:uncharacterized protein YraI
MMKTSYVTAGIEICVVLLLITGCASQDVLTPAFVTATLPPTITPKPTSAPLPPSPTATVEPVPGTVTLQINVRAGPSVSEASLGLLSVFDKVQIVGKDSSGAWFQILYSKSPSGTGWVTAQYILTSAAGDVPVVSGSVPATPPSGATSSSANVARVLQKLNVRSGPGTNYNSLGILNPDDQVVLTGKNGTGTWLQIEYPAGPGGRGWVSVAFVQVGDISNLPLLDEQGTPASPAGGTPASLSPAATPTIVPAPGDNDSAQNPSATMAFSSAGARQFSFAGDVSSPQGDAEDWIAVTPPEQGWLRASLTCTGNGDLTVQIIQNGTPITGWGALTCGSTDVPLILTPGQAYAIRLSAGETPSLSYVSFNLTIEIGQ